MNSPTKNNRSLSLMICTVAILAGFAGIIVSANTAFAQSGGDSCRVVDGNDLDWSGDPKSECSESVLQQQYDSICITQKSNSATLDVSNVPNSDEEIEKVTVQLEARASCSKGGYDGDHCSAFAGYGASLGSQSVSGSAGVIGGGTDTSSDTLTSNSATNISIDTEASANADKPIGVDSRVYAKGAGVGKASVKVCDVETGNPPTAVKDGDNSAQICNGISPQDIYVLANDSDPDGDSLSITDVDNPTDLNGTATIADDGVTDFIRYTPPDKTDKVDTFNYTIKDGNGGKDTARVKVKLQKGGCTGDIYVNFQSTDGGSVSVPSAEVHYNGDDCHSGSGTGLSCEGVELYDDGADAVIKQEYIDTPEEYNFADPWVKKNTGAPDNYRNTPNRSELGF